MVGFFLGGGGRFILVGCINFKFYPLIGIFMSRAGIFMSRAGFLSRAGFFTPFGVISSQKTLQWGVLFWQLHPHQGSWLWLWTMEGCFWSKATSLWKSPFAKLTPVWYEMNPVGVIFCDPGYLWGDFKGSNTSLGHFVQQIHPCDFLRKITLLVFWVFTLFHPDNINAYILYTCEWHWQGSLREKDLENGKKSN